MATKFGGSAGVTGSLEVDDSGNVTATSFIGPLTGAADTAAGEKAATHFSHVAPLYIDMAGAAYALTTANCLSEALVVDANGTGGGTSGQNLKLLSNATSTGKRLIIVNAGGEPITLQDSTGTALAIACVIPQSCMATVVYTAEVGWICIHKTPATFASTEITGNGSSQSTAHGLGVVPTLVWAYTTSYTSGAYTLVPGTHTTTNCLFTVTSGVKYRINAVAF